MIPIFWGNQHPSTRYFRVGCQGFDETVQARQKHELALSLRSVEVQFFKISAGTVSVTHCQWLMIPTVRVS